MLNLFLKVFFSYLLVSDLPSCDLDGFYPNQIFRVYEDVRTDLFHSSISMWYTALSPWSWTTLLQAATLKKVSSLEVSNGFTFSG